MELNQTQTSSATCRDYSLDSRLIEMNSPEVVWRCPCTGLECHFHEYRTIQKLLKHMQDEHCLTITYVD